MKGHPQCAAPPSKILPTPPLVVRRLRSGAGQERGRLGVEVINHLEEEIEVVWVETWPWWVRTFVHTLEAVVADNLSTGEDNPPRRRNFLSPLMNKCLTSALLCRCRPRAGLYSRHRARTAHDAPSDCPDPAARGGTPHARVRGRQSLVHRVPRRLEPRLLHPRGDRLAPASSSSSTGWRRKLDRLFSSSPPTDLAAPYADDPAEHADSGFQHAVQRHHPNQHGDGIRVWQYIQLARKTLCRRR